MSKIEVIKKGITSFSTDAVVNAANAQLQAGGGVCGAIFRDAGSDELTVACDAIGHCPTGSAVITPGFKLKAKYIIHAVGPVWKGGDSGEPKQLYDCYKKSLELARNNNCHSIAFPLISSGIFGYPKDKAWRKALQACLDFISKNANYDIDIYFAVLDDSAKALGEKTLLGLAKTDFNESESEKHAEISLEENQRLFCLRYIQLLQVIDWDEDLKDFCRNYSPYEKTITHQGLERMLRELMSEAYESNIVIHDYGQIIEESKLDSELICEPTAEFLNSLDKTQLLACIAWHFRRDHFSEGSLICESIAEGTLLRYMKALLKDEIKPLRVSVEKKDKKESPKRGMIYTELTKKAMNIAFRQHKDQEDKAGLPYIFHPYHLAEQMGNDEYAICTALLHDVAEDTDMTIQDIEKEGFPKEVITALKLLKHDDGVPYREYVKKIKPNPLAKKVKLADLYHNSDATRLPEPKNEEEKYRNEKRMLKYSKAIAFLEEK